MGVSTGSQDSKPYFFIEEGEPVDTACSGATTSGIGAMTSGVNTRDKTRNLSLKEVAEAKGPVSIQFDVGDKQTLNPLGPHAAHWSNYIGEVIRTVPLYYPSWEKVPKERKAALISNIGTLFDLRPHMESPRWSDIYEGINMHLQKAYNTNKASFKAKHWRVDPRPGLTMWRRSGRHVPRRLQRMSGISTFGFRMIPRTLLEPLKIGKTGKRAWSYLDRDPGRWLAFEMRWPQTLRSTLCSLTPSGEHTLLMRYSLRMRTSAYM
ncbi:hypothetical protein Tco_1262146 [Tanacetum coccineum]